MSSQGACVSSKLGMEGWLSTESAGPGCDWPPSCSDSLVVDRGQLSGAAMFCVRLSQEAEGGMCPGTVGNQSG